MRSVARTGSARTPTTSSGCSTTSGLDRAVVVGHSMGAFVTALLRRHPDRVERAVLVDGGFAFPPPPDQSR